MKFHQLFSNSIIGLDIQASCLRLVKASHSHRGLIIEQLVEQKLTANIMSEGKIKNWELLGDILIEWIDVLDIKNYPVVIHVPAQLVHMQRIHLPKGLNDAAIIAAITDKVRHDLPGLTDELSVDFSEIPAAVSSQNDEIELIFTVCRREYLQCYQTCVEASGLRVKKIDVDVYALLRAISLIPALSLYQETLVFLYATDETAMLSIFHHEELIFHQLWEVLAQQDFLQNLNTNIELFRARVPILSFDKVIIAVPDFIREWLLNHAQWRDRIHSIDPFAHLKCAENLDGLTIKNNFLIALGLVTGGVPVW